MSTSNLRAYGKLPLAREYLRIGCANGDGLLFRQLLDDAAGELIAGAGSGATRIAGQLERGLVAASVWKSRDSGGMREFPFSFFCLLPADAVDLCAGGWRSLTAVFAEHDRAYAFALGLQTASEFDARFEGEGWTVPIPEDAADLEPEPVPLAPWIESVHGDELEGFSVTLWRLRRALAEVADRGAGRLGGIRAPLSRDFPADAQVDGWLRIVGGHCAARGLVPSVLVTPGNEQEADAVAISFEALGNGLLGVASRGPRIVDLTVYREPLELDGFGEFTNKLEQLIGEPGSDFTSVTNLMR